MDATEQIKNQEPLVLNITVQLKGEAAARFIATKQRLFPHIAAPATVGRIWMLERLDQLNAPAQVAEAAPPALAA